MIITIIAWKPVFSDTEKPTRYSYLVEGETRERQGKNVPNRVNNVRDGHTLMD